MHGQMEKLVPGRAKKGPGTNDGGNLKVGVMTDDSSSFSAGINSQLTQAVIDVGFIACLRSRDSRVTTGSFNHAAFAITLSLQARRFDSHQLSSLFFFFFSRVKDAETWNLKAASL